ncbi:hypothetical protein ACE6H2_010860 [Prunus campanulata]
MPKEPEFETSQRVQSMRVKSTAELEEAMMAKILKFKARPLNKKGEWVAVSVCKLGLGHGLRVVEEEQGGRERESRWVESIEGEKGQNERRRGKGRERLQCGR